MKLSKIQQITLTIFVHLFLWFAFFLLPYIVAEIPLKWTYIKYMSAIWGIMIVFFYLNYYLLFPLIFLKKKIILYFLIFVVSLTSFHFTIIKTIDYQHNIHRMYSPKEAHGMNRPEYNSNPPRSPYGKPQRAVTQFYLLLFIGTVGTTIRLLQKWNQEEKNKEEQQKIRLAAELTYLKSQVNPHFLFNSLNSIYSLSLKHSEDTPDVILKLSELLRYMIYDTKFNRVPLQKEIENITNYIELQKIRVRSDIKINFTVEGKSDGLMIEPLLMIPIIENVFKHGIRGTGTNHSLNISIEIQNDHLKLETQNPNTVEIQYNEYEGIGLKNIKRRLELSYNEKYSFITDEKNGIFIVQLDVDLT